MVHFSENEEDEISKKFRKKEKEMSNVSNIGKEDLEEMLI
jgi:hypothetical protein